MDKKGAGAGTGFYRDVSRITLAGLAKITKELDEFHKELSARFQPALENMAQKDLPEASDHLNAVVDATETAATKIMDVLEDMQLEQEKVQTALDTLTNHPAAENLDTIQEAKGSMAFCQNGIITIFEELSFQDLTGQRIRRIVKLVQNVDEKVRDILAALGQLPAAEPDAPSPTEQKESLKGPQKPGEGLDQSAIDALLADL